MRRVFLSIGVDRVGGGVPWLPSAANHTTALASWASGAGYTALLFTDAVSPVRRASVVDAVTAELDTGDVERLVVAFCGHGHVLAPGSEVWLLSGAPDDPTEAIDLDRSIHLARYCGVPHVVFLSDACRVPPGDYRWSAVSGAPLFPNRPPAKKSTIDELYATGPGLAAYQLPTPTGPAASVFATSLLEGLSGHVDEVIEPGIAPVEPAFVVRTHALGEWLEREVPLRVAAIAPGVEQQPECRPSPARPVTSPRRPDRAPPPRVGPARGGPRRTTWSGACRAPTSIRSACPIACAAPGSSRPGSTLDASLT